GEPEYERYSPDREWMPRLVLMAKNTYVWLEQLSRKYQRWIKTLDQIPDEELDLLAQRGFTGLWLIGLWERSRASQRIKQRMGDPDAVASAYSLYAYEIAADLGGWEALANLRQRAWARGIRLAADMVPNHMGIDSLWVIEHPDWFLSLDEPPYPSYTFNGEDLSDHPRVGIFLEDHYYDRSDAAVVFKRLDRQSGEVRYIYHGNDGTSLPWNDTAQLDYTKAEVREAVIQTILHVARHFPIIRFDAAMTLAKKHIQRLWFPEPGTGGAIPSRAERGMSKSEFDAKVPNEFWRGVVDRVAAEIPDTLLLAEAFWFMEGYFVRTLGMHRVYNSAFMHMLRDEENAKYRQAIKNTLEFDPQILKRYVNFMNNPDEKTAIEQFGNGDKYFGVCTLLVTLPGLPMFGHGQIEGFREKYGMEFRRPKWEETPDEGLIRGHEWRIFPLLHRRSLFADVEAFCLFDFYTPQGSVDENVFAYSNRLGEERAVVIYHNKFAETQGWIRLSAASLDKNTGWLRQKSLGEALQLPHHGYVIVRDYVTYLERMFSCQELWEKGLYAELKAYECHVWLDWRFVEGEKWRAVYEALNGAAVESVQVKYVEMFATPESPAPQARSPQRMPRTKKVKRKQAAEKAGEKQQEKDQGETANKK
ncbi:MAG: alpha-amylase family glycosyl hydrolase, partial [Anaerolineae bacterium]